MGRAFEKRAYFQNNRIPGGKCGADLGRNHELHESRGELDIQVKQEYR